MDDQVSRTETMPPPVRKRRRVRPLLLLVLIAIVAALLWFHPWSSTSGTGGGGGGRRGPQGPQAVQQAPAVTADMPILLSALGTVTPPALVTVRTQIAGQLQEIGFKEGQFVKKGDFLAQIDPRPYQALLEQFQGLLARDQALLKQAQSDLTRYQTLARQDSISRQQADNQVYLVAQYQGTTKSDQAQIDAQLLNLTYCRIVAPVAGRVGLRQVDAGNYVQTSDANGIVVIAQTEPISVIFTIAEDSLPRVMQRLSAGATLLATAYDRSGTTRISEGTLESVDNQIDTTTGTVKIRASFPNKDEALFPNQFVNIQLLVDTLANVVVIPTAAIQRGVPGTYVFLVNADNTVSVRAIKIGPTDGERTAVLSGLTAGEKVVTDGADQLRDGAQITIPPPAGTSASAQPPAAAKAAKTSKTAQ